jgi:hypothetical protein
MHADGDVLRLHVLALATTELLEGQQLLLLEVVRHCLGVQDERLDALLDAPRDLVDHVGVLGAHVLRVSTEHGDGAVLKEVHLRTLAVVLVLARELLALEAVQDFGDGLGGLRQHGLERHTGRKLAVFPQVVDPALHQSWYDDIVGRQFTDVSLHPGVG